MRSRKVLNADALWEVIVFCVLFAAVTTWSFSVYPLELTGGTMPSGQGFYLFSKLLGLLTVIAIWWQVMGAILNHPLGAGTTLRRHKQSGLLVVLLGSLHYVFFMLAVYFRSGSFPLSLLSPVFDNYFRLTVSVGWFAFTLLLIGVLAAVFRRYIGKSWGFLHRLVYGAMVLGVLHGFLIGSETGFGAFYYIYMFLVASVVGGLMFRVFQYVRRRTSVAL
ncbi:hypothetical protein CK501_15640 [Halovibrio salipaludis]|uniref:Uncharacterized protein n=1 Tax=Halovibrio salipaludis TaxID=2032626 RepID=A0A2A2EX98_9GAMM|nr:ferric reductase-like transmembrane domain-containing protein [Halovibrio salipaludis]PAU76997.1 hypothetical protein CK501_15640 [Halovibrio salipaludis]